MPDRESKVEAARLWLQERCALEPRVGVVLGSGLAPLVEVLEPEFEVATAEIPHWPQSTVEGHAGRLLIGHLAGVPAVMLQGRVHAYEGYDLAQVVLPVRIMARLGIRLLLLTNAAGGIHPEFRPGDVMLIEDHLNLQGQSPLRGPNVAAWGPRFPDMGAVYDPKLRKIAGELASLKEIELQRGVYASVPGPQYETPAEIRMLATLGADAVGMSTVPEATAARHMGVAVLGFSVITNLAAGIGDEALSHAEVIETGKQVGARFSDYLMALLPKLDESLNS
ncbi:MAG: purine-nucleoside phosphorylase [Planctomycetes bacterium]|nr:purine-nucleoside phosphorylase [Planctomycetota bacterium]